MRFVLLAPVPLLLSLSACGSDTGADPGATMVPVGNMGTVIAATKDGITAFVQSGEHQSWVAEAAIHPSSGPHDDVRSYFNDKYASARRTNTYPMAVGATSVKELYDGTTLTGYAVAVKTKEGAAPESWTWYETIGLPDVKYFGVANPTCEGCHQGAADKDRSLTPTVP